MTRQRIYINDVVVRDGFQSEPAFVPTEQKIELINGLSETGLQKIEITSFVSPTAVPNLRDAAEVCAGIRRHTDVTYVALVPNLRGCERALDCGVDEINLVMSVSETHNLANMRMTTAQSLAQFREILQLAGPAPLRINGTVATAFGCPFEGQQPAGRVLDTAAAYLDMGMNSITLADTTGMANPNQITEISQAFLKRFPDTPLTLHFHNTRGMGLANVMAGVNAGIQSFDGSLGGLGGCPFAPGATGNICTEDTVHMLDACGFDTGVDLDRLLALSARLREIVGHELPGAILRAGKSTDLKTT